MAAELVVNMSREVASYDHVCIIFGHIEADTKEFTVNITTQENNVLFNLIEGNV